MSYSGYSSGGSATWVERLEGNASGKEAQCLLLT